MTAPTPAELDQQILDASKELAQLEMAAVRDDYAIATTVATIHQLRAQRYPDG